jgi:Uncharacterized protein conserved in bacteria
LGVASASLKDTFQLRLLRRLGGAVFATRLSTLLLPRQAPLELPVLPDDPWPGSTANADRLFQGRFLFAGVEVLSPHAAPWSNPATLTPEQLNLDRDSFAAWAAELHGFAWLRDFAAQGGDMAQRMSRSLVQSWLDHHQRIHGLAWRADIAGRRLMHWLGHGHFLLEAADERFAHDFLLGIARHAAYLKYAAPLAPPGLPRLSALLALAYAAECLPQENAKKGAAIRDLCATLESQILADGGHVSRNPAQVLTILRDVVALWRFLRAIDPEGAALLQPFLDRMAPMLRFFRHGDGGLALFHGSEEANPAQIDQVLELSEAKGKPLSSASLSRFERATARRSLLLIDVGSPPPPVIGARPHRGLLAFEFSHAKDRLVVNCGSPRRLGGSWAAALSGIAAHSTLMLGQLEPSPLAQVSTRRNEQDGAVWFEMEHDGWSEAFQGRLHRRRLYLSASGEDLRGEETVTPPRSDGMPVEAVLRLHLHPSVQASALGSGDAVILKSGSGQGWRFRSSGGVLRLEESVYFGSGGEARRTQQIVISGFAGAQPLVLKWALTKVG